MKETIKNNRTGISWTMTEMMEDLDFADDIALPSHRHRDMQIKTNHLANTAEKIGLKINITKTKIMKITESITLGRINIEQVQDFVYLERKITTDGGTMADSELEFLKPQKHTLHCETSGDKQRSAKTPKSESSRVMCLGSFCMVLNLRK